jgi:hypothetical protein
MNMGKAYLFIFVVVSTKGFVWVFNTMLRPKYLYPYDIASIVVQQLRSRIQTPNGD